jgi:O-antigen ligase
MDFIFGKVYYDISIVLFQSIFGLITAHLFFTNVCKLLKLNPVLKFILLAILLFPFLYPELYTANNICSEGLSYPFYLLLMYFTIDFLFRDKYNRIYLLIPVYILLVLTRGQFSIVMPSLILLFILKHKNTIKERKKLLYIAALLLTPFIANTLDSTYRKIVHGFFITTPFSYTNAITLPLYASDEADANLFEDEDHKTIFVKSYSTIDSLGLLSSKVHGNYKDKYQVFHDNFPKICNLNFYTQGSYHYCIKHDDEIRSLVETEMAAKSMFPLLLFDNFKEWLPLYFTNIIFGFKSIFIFLFFLGACIYGGWCSFKKFTIENGLLFFGSLLIVTNAFLVAFVVHTIMRYQFYYYTFVFTTIFITLKKIISAYEARIERSNALSQ